MAKKALRDFPREVPHGPWPTLLVTPEDRSYVPVSESSLGQRWRLIRASLDLLALDMGVATGKGAILGLFSFAVVFSFVTLYARGFCWWVGWHWAIGIGGLALLLALIGIDLTFVVVAVIAFVLSLEAMLTHPILLLLFIGCGVIIRYIIEFFPRRA